MINYKLKLIILEFVNGTIKKGINNAIKKFRKLLFNRKERKTKYDKKIK